ncbi:uncharacterized protein [Palaemon carinicauda]|uniref:uncharacterized protein n=1 Tax=Palaemon carinicauda TaxID=392227 RepID=UPI0035B5E5A6
MKFCSTVQQVYFWRQGSFVFSHRITPEDVDPLHKKLSAIQNFATISAIKALAEFMVIITYYHWLLSDITIPLGHCNTSLKTKPKDLKRCPIQEAAFCRTKKSLSTAAALTFPVPHAPLLIFAFDHELLTVYLAIRYFRSFLKGKHFVKLMDQRS